MEAFRDVSAATQYAEAKLKKTNLFESDRMFCDVYGLLPGQEQAGHVHGGSDKVYYVLTGTGEFDIGQEQRTVGTGHAVFAAAGESHAVRNPGPEPLSLLVFMAPKPKP